MSQYPQQQPQFQQTPPGWPTPPMGYAYPGMVDPLAKAKRAGLLVIISGALFLGCGGLFGLISKTFDQMMAMNSAEMRQSIPPEVNAQLLGRAAVGLTVFALVLLALGFAVRAGSRVATVVALVFTSLLLLVCGLQLLGAFAMAAQVGANAACGIVMIGAMVGLLAWQLVALIDALRGGGSAAAAVNPQAAYQAQYAQYLAQQQAYYQHQQQQQMPYGQGTYNAPPPVAPQGAMPATGWQWAAPPPPPPGQALVPPPPPPPPAQEPRSASGVAEGGVADGQQPRKS